MNNQSRKSNKRRGARSVKRADGAKGPRRSKRGTAPAVSAHAKDSLTAIVSMVAMPLFPVRSKRMMLPYYMNNSLSVPITGLAVNHVLSVNGLYDPDVTGTGTQPMGFDQVMLFYEHYTVLQCLIHVTFRNYSATMAPVVYLALRGDTTGSTDPLVVMSTGNTISTQLMPGSVFGSMKELTMRVDVRKFLGIDDLMDSDIVRGDVSSNPSEGAYFHIGSYNNETAVAGTVNFQVRLEYFAIFSEPRIITPSLSRGLHALIKATAECKI